MGTKSGHKVFNNNPIQFREYIDKIVRVKTIGNKLFEGTVYAIDPVSESVVLVRQKDEESSVEFVFGHAILGIECIGESKFTPKLFEETVDLNIDLNQRKTMLKNWLIKNMIPVEEYDEKLVFGDVVTIVPPYGLENCLCTNEIILGNIQRLIRSMPIQNTEM